MQSRINSDFEDIDHKTCRSICDAVGERLADRIRPEPMSADLERLMDELRRRDDELQRRPAVTRPD